MKIGFVGHPAHKWSRSADFFIETLKEMGEVSFTYPEPETAPRVLANLLGDDLDLYVFWQFDFLAYAFLAAHKNVIVIPMVDGSATYGSNHWKKLRDARFISFSKNLHEYLKPLGSESLHVQYFPKPAPQQTPPARNATYFWLRGQPNIELLKSVDKLFKRMSERKVVLRLDSPKYFQSLTAELERSVIQNRFELVDVKSREEHLEFIQQCDSLIAPRSAEGIGHGFLEGLAFGRAVIAKNYPTMNEYVTSGRNGFLYREGLVLPSKLDFVQMGRNALDEVTTGYALYTSRKESIKDFLSKPNIYKSNHSTNVFAEIMASVDIFRGNTFPQGKKRTLDEHIRFQSIFSFSNPHSSKSRVK